MAFDDPVVQAELLNRQHTAARAAEKEEQKKAEKSDGPLSLEVTTACKWTENHRTFAEFRAGPSESLSNFQFETRDTTQPTNKLHDTSLLNFN